MGDVQLMDCRCVEPLKQGVVSDWTCVGPSNGEVFQIGPNYLFIFLNNAIIRTRHESQCLPYAEFFFYKRSAYINI